MGLFSRSGKKTGGSRGASSKGEVFRDPFLYDAEFQSAHRKLVEGSWAEAQSVFDRRSDGWLLLLALTGDESAVSVETFRRWADAEPSGASIGLLGAAQTRDAWAIRGNKTADKVESGSWKPFKDGLREAEETLLHGVDVDPNSPEPWAALMNSGRGLGKSKSEIRSRFDNAHARAPFRSDICGSMLQALCAKWGGSHAEMFQFARWVEGNAEPGGAAHSVLPAAHFEKAMYEDDLKPSTYFTQPEVSNEMKGAARVFLGATPENPEPSHLATLNYYCFLLIPTDGESARLVEECYRRLGDKATGSPWNYFNDYPGARYVKIRKLRLSEARRF